MRNLFVRIALTGILAGSWAVAGAEDARLLLNPSSSALEGNGLPTGWQTLRFRNVAHPTDYSVSQDGDGGALKAVSDASASGIFTEVDLDAGEYPLITWEWKVTKLIEKGDATKTDGDDFPARIIVAFHYDPTRSSLFKRAKYEVVRLIYGRYPPGSALLYVWDNRLPVGSVLDNANTPWAKMIVLESGPSKVTEWIRERRNFHEDYVRAFGNNPPRVRFIGIMTDTDDTGERAVTYYRRLMLERSREQ